MQYVHASFVNQADVDVVNTAIKELDTLSGLLNAPETSDQQFDVQIARTNEALDKVISHQFYNISPEYLEGTYKLKEAAKALKSTVATLIDAFIAQGEQWDRFLTTYTADIHRFQQAIDATTTPVMALKKSKALPYLLAAILTLGITTATFAWAYIPKKITAKRRRMRRDIALASFFPFAIAAGTYLAFVYLFHYEKELLFMAGTLLFALTFYIVQVVFYVRGRDGRLLKEM